MILKEETLNSLSIDVDKLSQKSHKRIIVKCDYCSKKFNVSMKNRSFSYNKLPKDACYDCRYKKREDVSLQNYGVKNSSQRQDVRDKIAKSNADWINSEEFNKKRRSTMMKKYGTDNVMMSNKLREKIQKTLNTKYGVDNPMKINGVAKAASKKAIDTKIKNGTIKTINGLTLPERAKTINLSRSFFGNLIKSIGIEEALQYEAKYSSLENKIFNFLTDLNLRPQRGLIIDNKRPDILVNNLVIECDGLYWCCDHIIDDNMYHYNKSVIYKNNGLRPLFFRGDEIEDKFDIVQSIIINSLHLNKNKIYARNTNFKEISNLECFNFCEHNHLMGGFKSTSRSFALLYGDEIVSIFQVKESKNNSGKYDLSRYCTIKNTSVVGGFTKMLTNFEKLLQPSYLQTFIDLRYGNGEYLLNHGFNNSFCNVSFKWTDGVRTFHKTKFKGNSGYENGLNKIWDCGQQKMIKLY